MRRRQLLALVGGYTTAITAGCLGAEGGPDTVEPDQEPTTEQVNFEPVSGGPRNGDDLPADGDPLDGYPPRFDSAPPERTVDPSRFRTMTVDPASFSENDSNGVVVPLVSIDVAFYWYWSRTARFADARAPGGYDNSHIYGAVSSPAPAGGDGDDPIAGWPTDGPIVCYCGCPHHLSGMRAATLLNQGYEQVYVIDEGFWEWQDRDYPLAGTEVESRPALRVIEGLADPTYAGATAWVFHKPTDQVEAGPIGADGRFRLQLRFNGVSGDSVLRLETPGYTVTAPLRELTTGVVKG